MVKPSFSNIVDVTFDGKPVRPTSPRYWSAAGSTWARACPARSG